MSLLNKLFPGTNRAIQAKGAAVAGGTGPVRMKKAPSLIQSIVGVFVGIALVFGSPIAMWYAQSQHGADDFASAVEVSVDSGASGYITFSGAPEFAEDDGGAACYEGSCLYQTTSHQELITREDIECGNHVSDTSMKRVYGQNGSECDEYGDCVPCYDVEIDSWEEQSSSSVSYDVTIGGFMIQPTASAVYFDLKEKIVDTGYDDDTFNETRSVYEYMPLPATLLVAGESDGSIVTKGELTYVLSQYNSVATLQMLEARDQANQYMLWFVTFIMLVIGISMILGPLEWLGRKMRYAPVVGPWLAKGSRSLLGLAAFIIAVPLWIILFIVISIVKSWIAALITLVVIGVLAFILIKKRASKDESSATVPPAAPQG